jgi:hypothetical protein
VRRESEQRASLAKRLADQPEPVLLEVAQAAVDQARRSTARPGAQIIPFDQRDPEPARRSLERDAHTGDPAAHHDDVE